MPMSRRRFFFGSLALPALTRAAKPAGERPNVALILADGLPAWILGCYGGKEIRTPNIDCLAQAGARFRRHFTAAPAAEPGRASLLTGGTGMQVGAAPLANPAASPLATLLSGLGYACHWATAGSAEAVAEEAGKFLDQQAAGKPFFLVAGFSDLRPPYGGISEKYAAAYADAKLESFFPSDPPAANATAGKDMLGDPLGSLRKAAAAITAVDGQVGALISKLAGKGLLDATLVVFTSPGGSLLTRHGLWGSGDSSDPANMYEEAVTTPMIWRWPARIPPQTTRTEAVSSVDLLPAIAELTAAPLAGHNLSGRSYLALAMGKPLPPKQPWRNVVYSHLQNTDMVRDSRYKLVLRNGGQGPNEFYDVVDDPREQTNGYQDGRFNSVRPALAAEIEKWKIRYSSSRVAPAVLPPAFSYRKKLRERTHRPKAAGSRATYLSFRLGRGTSPANACSPGSTCPYRSGLSCPSPHGSTRTSCRPLSWRRPACRKRPWRKSGSRPQVSPPGAPVSKSSYRSLLVRPKDGGVLRSLLILDAL